MHTYIYVRDTCSENLITMSSKVFETIAIQFHHQFATRVRNMLTELEFYIFIYKDLKMFYWVSTMEFSGKSHMHSGGVAQTLTPIHFAFNLSGAHDKFCP